MQPRVVHLAGTSRIEIPAPDEIAAAAVYLASDDADYLHGTTLTVDGGRLAA